MENKKLEVLSKLSNGELVKRFRTRLTELERKETILSEDRPHEILMLKNSLKEAIDIMEPQKIRMLYGFAFSIGNTPEQEQLVQLGIMIHEVKDEINKRITTIKGETDKRLRWLYLSLGALATGIISGLNIEVIAQIVIEVAKVIFA